MIPSDFEPSRMNSPYGRPPIQVGRCKTGLCLNIDAANPLPFHAQEINTELREATLRTTSLYINGVQVLVSEEEFKLFQELIFKGSNTWSNKPIFLRKLVDLIIHGKFQFDYDNMPQRKFEQTTEGVQHAAAQQAQRVGE